MKTQNTVLGILSVCLGGLFCCSTVLGTYQIIDMGTLGGDYSAAYSINNSGQIVGSADNSSGDSRAVLFDASGSGANLDLKTLGGSYSSARFINNNGQIVGSARLAPGSLYGTSHATLFDSSGAGNNDDSSYFSGGGVPLNGAIAYSWANSINNNLTPMIVGRSSVATLFDLGGAEHNKNLGALNDGNMSEAYSVNDIGQIVGWSKNALLLGAKNRATVFDPTGAGNNIDLGTIPGYTNSYARCINNSNKIVGYAENATGYPESINGHAVLFDITGAGNNIDLGTLPGSLGSQALYINNLNQIVGTTLVSEKIIEIGHMLEVEQIIHATLFDYTGAGNNIDLNTYLPAGSGWTLTSATAVNDNGWIVGEGTNPAGQTHAFLLKPIPEPCTLVLLALGGLLIHKRNLNANRMA